MASSDILRYIETIALDRDIDREQLIAGIEQAVAQGLAKKYGLEDLELHLDRTTGEWICNYEIDLENEGRILAQAVKQAIIGRVREAERDVLYDEYERKLGEIVTGTVQRFEGDTTIVNLGRNMEGILPRSEKVRGEVYNVGDRIRAMVLEVKKVGSRVKVILTRAHRDLVRALFELEVPEIAEGIITIRRIEREPGYRTKLAVDSSDEKVDCVGACVGVRGTRIKSIIDELNGERIDIIRWSDDSEQLIVNALKPADISHIELDHDSRKALVLVDEANLSLAIGRKGQNVRLASKLTHWDIDIMTRAELEQSFDEEEHPAAAGGEAAATQTLADEGALNDTAAGGTAEPGAGAAADAGTEASNGLAEGAIAPDASRPPAEAAGQAPDAASETSDEAAGREAPAEQSATAPTDDAGERPEDPA